MTKEEGKNNQRIVAHEQLLTDTRKLTLMSDVFMSVALQDIPACQHVLRILTGIPTLTVKEVRTQYSISKIISHDARLDVLAEDENGKLYNIEIQRADTVDHAKRTRFYGAMIDSEFLQKGKDYDELPDVHIIYISETDLWNAGRTTYPVKKYFDGTDISYDDGIHVLYVNTAVDDKSEIADLMQYFKTADPEDDSQGDLSRRVHFLKGEEGGSESMCEAEERIKAVGREEGRENQARKTALNLSEMGMTVDKISQAIEVSSTIVQEWLAEEPPTA